MELSKHAVVIQTNHLAILDIMKQSSITLTTSTMRMNVRLVCASQFLCPFQSNVRHKPGKEHIVPDALSSLASVTKSTLPKDHLKLDVLYACATQALPSETLYSYTATMIEMSESFRDRLLLGYNTDPHWKRIASIIDDNAKHNGKGANLSFVCRIDEALIFYQNKFT